MKMKMKMKASKGMAGRMIKKMKVKERETHLAHEPVLLRVMQLRLGVVEAQGEKVEYRGPQPPAEHDQRRAECPERVGVDGVSERVRGVLAGA